MRKLTAKEVATHRARVASQVNYQADAGAVLRSKRALATKRAKVTSDARAEARIGRKAPTRRW